MLASSSVYPLFTTTPHNSPLTLQYKQACGLSSPRYKRSWLHHHNSQIIMNSGVRICRTSRATNPRDGDKTNAASEDNLPRLGRIEGERHGEDEIVCDIPLAVLFGHNPSFYLALFLDKGQAGFCFAGSRKTPEVHPFIAPHGHLL